MPASISIDVSKEIDKIASEQRRQRDGADELVVLITAEDRDFTPDEQKAYDEKVNKAVELGKRADRLKVLAESRATDSNGKPRTTPDDVIADADKLDKLEKLAGRNRSAAFTSWVRGGMPNLTDEQRSLMRTYATSVAPEQGESRALSTLLGNTGGFLCPPEFSATVELAMRAFAGVEQAGATILPTSTGNDLPMPTSNDTNNEGEQVEENTATTERDVNLGLTTLKGFTFSSRLVLVPIQLLEDSLVNIDAFLAGIMGERLGRIINRRTTTGNGANQPQGVVNGSALGRTAAGAAAITYDETIDLQHAVDPAYRNLGGCGYMFHDTTLNTLRKLKDSDGRPIWQPSAASGMAAGVPNTLNGDRYTINNNMAVPGAGNRSMLYGDFSKYYIRTIGGTKMVRLTERYAERFQVGFFAFRRMDGRIIDAGVSVIRHLVHP